MIAMDLRMWAQLNLIGHVTYGDYLEMSLDGEEAKACYKALKDALAAESQVKTQPQPHAGFDELCNRSIRGM